jgi:ureidoglycolate hydrolase
MIHPWNCFAPMDTGKEPKCISQTAQSFVPMRNASAETSLVFAPASVNAFACVRVFASASVPVQVVNYSNANANVHVVVSAHA